MKLMRWTFLFVLMLPVIPLFVEAQETNRVAVSPREQLSTTNSKPGTNLWQVPAADAPFTSSQLEEIGKRFEEIKAKAEKGDVEAQYTLGVCCQGWTDFVPHNDEEAVKWYRKAAEQNYAPAQLKLGLCYATGQGVAVDTAEAVKWYRKAAEGGDAVSQGIMGASYEYGQDVPQDYVEAVKWYRRAANQGDADSQRALGDCYAAGTGVAQDFAEAVTWYRKAAEQNNAWAQYSLGQCYDRGQGVPQDAAEAVKWYQKAAEQRNWEAELSLGRIFSEGKIVPKDISESIKWYRKAAEEGLYSGQLALARIYYYGKDPTTNFSEALKWLHKAADQRVSVAQYELGLYYSNPPGGTNVPAEALKWFTAASEKMHFAPAEVRLGEMYDDGIGVAKNPDEATKWYLYAVDWDGWRSTNYSEFYDCCLLYGKDFNWSSEFQQLEARMEHAKGIAKFDLQMGLVCENDYVENGHVMVPKDYTEAAKWYLKAANQNAQYDEDKKCVATAQGNLGRMYYSGVGVPQDFVEAYKWLNLAAANGLTLARFWRDRVAEQMTPDQIAEAQELSRQFKPHKESGSNNSISSDQPTASGTGFFITEDGYLISNYHVVKDAAKVRLLTSAGTLDAKVVQVDAANDLALLKTDGNFSPLPVVSSRKVQLGNTVATVGFPNITLQGFAPKLAKGEIAALSGAEDDARYFQISVPVQPGNSGGALVDERGNVVGIVSAKLDVATALAASGSLPENVNYAVKSSFLLSFLESVPAVAKKLKEPNTRDEKFEDVVKSAEAAAVLVLVY